MDTKEIDRLQVMGFEHDPDNYSMDYVLTEQEKYWLINTVRRENDPLTVADGKARLIERLREADHMTISVNRGE